MTIERTAGRVAATTLAALAGLHVAWGLGSPWPLDDRAALSDAVVGGPDTPGPAACFAAAGALGVAALLVSGRPRSRPALSRIGAAGVAGVLGVRGVAGVTGQTDLLSPGSSSPRFRRLDRRAYGPLCLALAGSAAVAAARRGR